MSSPRKFAEKIALLQQKQVEDDAAFHTILHEVEAAKQKADRVSSTKIKPDESTRKYETSNGINHSENNYYLNQSIKIENNDGFDRLLLPPDNPSWRRTHSDSSLHQSMMPTVLAHYHAQLDNEDNNQQLSFDLNETKLEPPSYDNTQHQHQHHHHSQLPNSQFQPNYYYDLNNNNYAHEQTNMFYPSAQQTMTSSTTTATNNTHTILGPRFSGGNTTSNVLMLPPNQYPRGGGSLPDLRNGNTYNQHHLSLSATPSPPQQFLRSPSPQSNGDGDLYALGPQQQLPSRSGPVKQSPGIRRRHSPIGDGKQSSPRRQNSPTPDVSSAQHAHYRVETQSPPSVPSYSPQNSPRLLPSPGHEINSFSPQQQSTDNQQPYYTLPNDFDQITLDNAFYTQQQQQQQQQQSPSSSQQQQQHNHSLPTTPSVTNGFAPRDFYSSYIDDMASNYSHTQTPVAISTNGNQKSPTIPNIILTDVDSSKLDLSKELANDFSNPFDSLIDTDDLQLNTDDFLLTAADLSIDPNMCDGTFRMER